MGTLALTAILAVMAFVLAGSICGLAAILRLRNPSGLFGPLEARVGALERRVRGLEAALAREDTTGPAAPLHVSVPPVPVPRVAVAPVLQLAISPRPASRPDVAPEPPLAAAWRGGGMSLEVMIGAHWTRWVGAVLSLVGVALGLKYAYDNSFIGPAGRLAIGVLSGVAALGAGEYLRRREWRGLFQTLTGLGIAIFYICVFFSFEIYGFTGQGVSMALAVLVTGLAIGTAVAHDAPGIAVLGLIGGFLSPVLLSTGVNAPYALFTYIAILDLVALGVTWSRNWRGLNLLCFAATGLLYQAWYMQFHGASDPAETFAPGLVYTTVFYLMFLLVPTAHGLVRRGRERIDGILLVVANAGVSFYCYHTLLFDGHRHALAGVALLQALAVFLLYVAWIARRPEARRTAQSLLLVALALAVLAVPIELRLYGVPLAWCLEGVLFVCLGVRFRALLARLGGLAALGLAALALFDNLPLHDAAFRLVLNPAFGSWSVVAAACAVAAVALGRARTAADSWEHGLVGAPALVAFVLGAAAITLEAMAFWRCPGAGPWRIHQSTTLVVLWAALSAGTVTVLRPRRDTPRLAWALGVYGVGALFFLDGLAHYGHPSTWLAANLVFAPRLAFLASLWWGARVVSRDAGATVPARVLECVGHGVLAVLLAAECLRWCGASDLLDERTGLGLVSAIWAALALGLVWAGLVTRSRTRRYAGFVLFGLTVGKVLIVDTAALEQVYRIVSYLATGVLLLVAATAYQRYAPCLIEEEHEQAPS